MKKLFLSLICMTSIPLFCAEAPTEGIIKINGKNFNVPIEVFDYYALMQKATLKVKKENELLKKELLEAKKREEELAQENVSLKDQLTKSQEYARALKKENRWHREKSTPEKSKTPSPSTIRKMKANLKTSHSYESLKDLTIQEEREKNYNNNTNMSKTKDFPSFNDDGSNL